MPYFLGDSITFGYELRDGEKPYPHLSQKTTHHKA